ncbi:hypothetical protein COO60DRAFT_110443 [Scenedesmus sp. NREL 46B-D3]|nr:hypothetical protein COO60DRAFT_110443 [Scenedesmus sp. NREL 46B-D3]
MGACCSSQLGSAQAKQHGTTKGPATHDSAWSVDEPCTAAANGTATASGPGAKQQQARCAAGSAAKKQGAAKRVANTDLMTGEIIPDMGVHGVFDVLYELGSGGSGRTFLCRDMASGKVRAVKFVPRPLAKSAIPFMMAEVEIQVTARSMA